MGLLGFREKVHQRFLHAHPSTFSFGSEFKHSRFSHMKLSKPFKVSFNAKRKGDKQTMINPFKRSKDYPQTELEEKWNFVGLFSAFMAFFILTMPLLFVLGQVRNVPEASLAWFGIMTFSIVWLLFYLFTLRWWLQLSHNFGLMMYQLEQQSEKKRRLKLNAKTEET
jgi:hypothetical protein